MFHKRMVITNRARDGCDLGGWVVKRSMIKTIGGRVEEWEGEARERERERKGEGCGWREAEKREQVVGGPRQAQEGRVT